MISFFVPTPGFSRLDCRVCRLRSILVRFLAATPSKYRLQHSKIEWCLGILFVEVRFDRHVCSVTWTAGTDCWQSGRQSVTSNKYDCFPTYPLTNCAKKNHRTRIYCAGLDSDLWTLYSLPNSRIIPQFLVKSLEMQLGFDLSNDSASD